MHSESGFTEIILRVSLRGGQTKREQCGWDCDPGEEISALKASQTNLPDDSSARPEASPGGLLLNAHLGHKKNARDPGGPYIP